MRAFWMLLLSLVATSAAAEEADGERFRLRPTHIGTPQSCRPVNRETPEAAIELGDVMNALSACYTALLENGDPYLNRRTAYSGAASVGALGGSLAAGLDAASGTVSWFGGVMLLPMIVESTFDRPEFDAVDRVAARSLNWINGRAVELDAYQRLEAAQFVRLESSLGALSTLRNSDPILDFAARLRNEAEAAGMRVPAANAAPAATTSYVSLEAYLGAIDQLERQGGDVKNYLYSHQSYLGDVLPSWANERFRHVLDTYEDSRRAMTLRPDAAIRNVLALPLSVATNFVRGSAPIQADQYYGNVAAQELRDVGRPLSLPTRTITSVTLPAVNLADFASGDDRAVVRGLMAAVAAAHREIEVSLQLIDTANAINQARAPDLSTPGSTRQQSEDAGAAVQRAAAASESAPRVEETGTQGGGAAEASGGEARGDVDVQPSGQ